MAPETPLRTLVVDDVEGQRRLVTKLLEDNRDYDVVGEAADGREALATAGELDPDLVLLDLSMPGMDGFEVLERMREEVPDAALVVLSGHEDTSTRERARKAGAAGYVVKGISPVEMVEEIVAVVETL